MTREAMRSVWTLQKSEAYSTGGMITAEHPVAAEAGARILEAGGNAVDAAVAAAFVMGVVEPVTSGVGGVAWCVIRQADGTVTTVEGTGSAPRRATPDMYRLAGGAAGMYAWPATEGNLQNLAYLSVGVPGAVGCYCRALERHGSMTRADVLRDAIALADGWSVDWPLALAFAQCYERLMPHERSRATFFKPNGAPLRAATGLDPADQLIQRDLGDTLRAIAADGPGVVYDGPVGRAIVEDVRAHGGLLSVDDLAAFEVIEQKPLAADYRGVEIRTLQGASGGVTVVEALRILEGFSLGELEPLSSAALHLIAEAGRRAFADRFAYLADPDVVGIAPYQRLASAGHAARARGTIRIDRATPDAGATPYHSSSDCTTHINAVDRDGRMVSLTSTLGGAFGSGVVAGRTGVLLGNVMTWFDPRPGRPNSIAGGKNILPAVAPLLLLRDGAPFLCAGALGGRRIISAMIHVVTNVVDWGLGAQQVVNAPRVHCESDEVLVDALVPRASRDALTAMGHRVSVREETITTAHFGRPSAILIHGSERRAGVGALKIATAIGVDG